MTYSLRGSYIHRKHSTGRHLPCQPRQLSRVNLTRSKSCMPKIRPREAHWSAERKRSKARVATRTTDYCRTKRGARPPDVRIGWVRGKPAGLFSLWLTGRREEGFQRWCQFRGAAAAVGVPCRGVAEPGEFDVQGVRDDGFQAVKCDAKVGGALATAEQEHLTGNGLEGFHLVTCLDD